MSEADGMTERTMLQDSLLIAMLTSSDIGAVVAEALEERYGPAASRDDDRLREAVRDLKALEAAGLCDLNGVLQ